MNRPKGNGIWENDNCPDAGGPSTVATHHARINVPAIDPDWINLDTIHTWMRVCNETHQCAGYPSFGTAPAWLIDVHQECLVSPASLPDGDSTRYCALSYVWGQAKTSKLTMATQESFCQPGAFAAENPGVEIPKTIRHTIELVKALGEKYLWVDTFCIVQDDDAHFHAELRNMGAIYDKACLTVVAATGWDANEGFKGLRGISPRRHLASNFADDLHKYTNPEHMIWNSRGWTFQEGQFSRRKLMFCDQTVVWECTACTMDEAGSVVVGADDKENENENENDGDDDDYGSPSGGRRMTFLRSRAPDIHVPRVEAVVPQKKKTQNMWNKIKSSGLLRGRGKQKEKDDLDVQHNDDLDAAQHSNDLDAQLQDYFSVAVRPFNTRNLTHSSDLPLAFEGIAYYLVQNAASGSLFAQGVCWGMPVARLPQALLWCTRGEDLRPRSATSVHPRRDDTSSEYPSWSWFAWEGEVTATCVGAAMLRDGMSDRVQRVTKSTSICDWELAETSGNINNRRISYERPKKIRITAERCFFSSPRATKFYRPRRQTFFRLWPTIGDAMVYPDSSEGFDDYIADGGSVILLGISEFTGCSVQGFGGLGTFVEALWVTNTDSDPDGSSVQRRGVAIVERSMWNSHQSVGASFSYLLE